MRWYSEERKFLFSNFQYYCALEDKRLPGFPKYSSFDAESILKKIYLPGDESFTISSSSRKTENFVNYQEATQYWIKAMNRLPFYEKNGVLSPPAHGRTIYFSQEKDAYIACLVMNSSLFYVYFNIFSDCYHLGDSLVKSFPVHTSLKGDKEVPRLISNLMDDLEERSNIQEIKTSKGDEIRYALYTYSDSKAITDKIDHLLAEQYGFTDIETDFIANYDIKYRMSLSSS